MASTIAAVTTGGGGVITTADSSGNLSLLSGATTVVAVTSAGVAVTGTLAVSGAVTLTTALPVLQGGTGVTTSTGTGAVVLGTGPSISSAVMTTMASSVITIGTPVTASGTSISFTSIPSWVKRITLSLSGISTNGTSLKTIRIGPVGGVETSGYLGGGIQDVSNSSGVVNYTTGFACGSGTSNAAAWLVNGTFTLTLLNASTNLWSGTSMLCDSASAIIFSSAGSKPLAGTLTQVSLTTQNGTDTFDAGSINILYE